MFNYVLKKFSEENLDSVLNYLKQVNPSLNIDFVKNVIEWFYLSSFWGVVSGDLNNRSNQFCTIANEKTGIDKRAFQLVIFNLKNLYNPENDILKKYFEGLEAPANLELSEQFENVREQREINSNEFWINVGETLEPVRDSLQSFSDFGNSILSGDLIKKILIAGIFIFILKILLTKKTA